MNDVIEEANGNITSPSKHSSISFSQSVLRDTTYNLEGRYPINRRNYSGKDKDYKTYGKTQLVDKTRTLLIASQFGSILNLTAWDPQLWPEVIDRQETDAVRAWQNQTHSNDIWKF